MRPTTANFIIQGAGATISSTITVYLQGNLNQGAITCTGSMTVFANSRTVTMTDDWDIGGDFNIYGMAITNAFAALNTNTNNLTVGGNLRLGYSTAVDNSNIGKILFSSGTHTITGNMDVHGDVQTYGYFDLGSGTLNVGGNVDFRRSDVTIGTGTVNLTGAGAVTLYGVTANGSGTPLSDTDHLNTTPFYDLTCTTAGKAINFEAGKTVTVANDLTFTGTSGEGNDITLRSTSAETAWNLNVSGGAYDMAYLDVQDSNSTNGIFTTASTDSGRNTNWVFGNAGEIVWTNYGGDGLFSTAGNWSTGSVPGAGENAVFNATSTDNCSLAGAARTLANFTMEDGYTTSDSYSTTGKVTLSGTAAQDLTVTDTITINDGKLTDNGRQVNFVNAAIANESGRLTSTGTWKQTASGTIVNGYYSNEFYKYEIPNGVTSTLTGTVAIRCLELLGASSTVTGGTLRFYAPAGSIPAAVIIQPEGATISSGINIEINADITNQGALTCTGDVKVFDMTNDTLTMTGDWNIGGYLRIFGKNSAGTAGMAILDTNGNNLTVGGYLRLGSSVLAYPDMYHGKILFSSGTHSIGGKIQVAYDGATSYTHGHFDFGSSTVSVGGDIDFRYATVTPGTSTVILTGATPTIYSIVDYDYDDAGDPLNTAPFYNLTSTTAGQAINFEAGKTVTVANDLTFTGTSGEGNDITLRSTDDVTPTAWNLNLSGNSLNLAYLDVKDSNATGNGIATVSSTNSGNNTNWYFGSASDIVWTNGAGDGNFATAGNWSTGAVPGAGENAVFNATSTDNCAINQALSAANITLASGYSGTVTASSTGGQNITLTGDLTVTQGTFDANGRDVGCVNVTASGSTARVLDLGEGTWTVSGNWNTSGTNQTIETCTSIVDLTGAGSLNTKANSSSPYDFYDLKAAHDTKTSTLSSDVHIGNSLYIYSGGTVTANDIYLYKSDGDAITNTGATISSDIRYTPNAAISAAGHTFGGDVYYEGRTDNVAITLSSAPTVTGDIYIAAATSTKATTLDAGTYNISCNDLYLGDSTDKNGVIDFGTGTHTISGNLQRKSGAASTGNAIDMAASTIGIAGDFNLTGITLTQTTATVNMTGASKTLTAPANLALTNLNMNGTAQAISLGGNLTISGQFTPGTSTATFIATDAGNTINIPVYSAGSATLNKFYNLTINGAGGSFSTSNNLRVGNDFTLTQGTFDSNSKTLYIGNNLDASGSSTRVLTITPTFTVTIEGDCNLSGSNATINTDNATVVVNGDLDFSGTNTYTHLGSTTTLTLSGAGAQAITTGSATFKTVNFTGAGPFSFSGDFQADAAAVTGEKTINVTEDFKVITTFTEADSTVVMNGTSATANIDIPTYEAFNNLTINGSGSQYTLQKNLTVAEDLTITSGTLIDNAKTVSFKDLSIADTSGLVTPTAIWTQTASGTITNPNSGNKLDNVSICGTGVTTTFTGDVHTYKWTLADGTLAGAGYDIYLYGALSAVIFPAGATTVSSALGNIYLEALTSQIAFQLPDSLVTGAIYIKATTQGGITALGNWNCGNNAVKIYETPAQDSLTDLDTYNFTCGDLELGYPGQITYGADLRLGSGTHSIGSISKAYSGTPSGTLALLLESSTINCTGSLDFTNIALTSGTSTMNMTGTGAKTMKLGGQVLNNLTFNNASGTWTLQDTLDVKGNLTRTAGTFSHNNKDVVISGASESISTIDGPFTFYNFTCTSEGKVIKFKQGETQTFAGTLTFTGGAGAARISIRSDIDDLTHTLAPTAASVSYADIKDSILSIQCIASNSFDSGNNTNWILNPTFTITAPASGATLDVDSTAEVAWTAAGGVTEVKLWYSTDASAGTPAWTLITPVAIANSDGANTYNWTVPDAISEDCKIKVAAVLNDAVDESAYDLSDTFNIRGIVSLTYPNAEGIGWPVGEARNITFTKTGTLGDVKIYCSTTGAEGDVWGTALTTASGTSYSWSPTAGYQSSNCYTKIEDADNANVYDISDNSFSVGVGSLESVVITDAGGAAAKTTFLCGNSYDIGWTTSGTVASVDIAYSTDGGSAWTDIKASVDNDDEYNGTGTGDDGPWVVTNTPSANALIRVMHSSDSNIYALTDTVTIAAPFTVTTPPADIILTAGTSYVIGWTTTAGISADTVDIEFSTDNGSTWTEIVSGTANDHAHTWNITEGTSTSNAKIRISNADDATGYAYADSSAFKVKRGSVTVTVPNTGVTWKVGEQRDIQWTKVGTITNVKLSYCVNGDQETPAWQTLLASIAAGGGVYTWTIPDDVSDNCLVKVEDTLDSEITDTSDTVFSIKPVITVTAPNGGQNWVVGTANNIEWSTTGTVSQVDLQYTTDGTNYTNIVSGLTNTGTYAWTIPTADSAACKVKVISTADSSVSDTSDAAFTISLANITVTVPAAGNIWARGDTKTIKWSTAGTIYNDLKIEYSPGGAFSGDVVEIDTGQANDGTYSWVIANDLTVSATAKIKISDTTWAGIGYTVSGTSDAFEITAPKRIVLAPDGGETLTVGDSFEVTWSTYGTTLDANVKLVYSTDGFTTSTTITASTADDASYTWTNIPDAISDTVKLRVIDAGNETIYDTSDANFSIKGALAISAPAAEATLYVGVDTDITWTTTGTIDNVNLFYADEEGGTYKNMAGLAPGEDGYTVSTVANDESYTWSVADVVFADKSPNSNVYFKIVDANDSDVYSIVQVTVSYYTVIWTIEDEDNLIGELSALEVSTTNASTGLSYESRTGLSSPVSLYYKPNDYYNSTWSRSAFLDGSDLGWQATENNMARSVDLPARVIEKESIVEGDWHYNPENDRLFLSFVLRQQETIIGGASLTEAFVKIFEADTELTDSDSAYSVTISNSGEVVVRWDDLLTDGVIESGTRYIFQMRVLYMGAYYWGWLPFDISEMMMFWTIQRAFGVDPNTETISSRLTSVQSTLATTVASQAVLTKAAVAAGTATTASAITAGTSSTASAITTSQATIASAVTSSQSTITSAVSSRILNEAESFRTGDTFEVRYATTTGTTCTIDIYDEDQTQIVTAAAMTEISSTGIFKYDFKPTAEGLYSIVCSGSNGTIDSYAVLATSTDLATISASLSSVSGAVLGIDTASLASAAATIATLESSLAGLSGALGGLTSMASEIDSISSELNQSISSALANISRAFDNVTSQVGVDLGKMGQIAEAGAQERKYIQDKTVEIDTGLKLVKEMVASESEAPVQTTWMVSSETAALDAGIPLPPE